MRMRYGMWMHKALGIACRRRRAAGEVQYREQQLQTPFKSKADEDRAHMKQQHV